MNNRNRRVARLKEQETQRVFKKEQQMFKDLIQAMDGVKIAWELSENGVYRSFFKEVAE